MAGRILTKGLRTGIGSGGVRYIIMRGLVSDLNPPDPSEGRLIVISIINKLKTISMSRGFFTDVNSCVVDWEFKNIEIANLPCIEVRDTSEDSEVKGTLNYRAMTVEIVGRILVTDMNDARNFQQDIESAMTNGPVYPNSVYLSRLIERSELLPEQKDKKIVKITMSYEVKYRTSIF